MPVDDISGLPAAELLELNRDLQGSRALRLLVATNLSLYATFMERQLSGGALPETELVVYVERDLEHSLDGRDREIAVPRLTFTEPITTLVGVAT
jgi:hypothetical protein